MKKISLLIALFLFSASLSAQISLIHTFTSSYVNVNYGTDFYLETDTYPSQTYSINVLDKINNTYTITIYNANFQVQSNTVYNIPVISGYTPSTVSFSRKMFNDTNDLELLVQYNTADSPTYNQNSRLILFSENGTQLFDFGYAYGFSNSGYLHIFNNEYRWALTKLMYDETTYTVSYATLIYRVPKSDSYGLQQVPAQLPNPYPNPANSSITIPLDENGRVLNIYDINGRKIQSIPTDGEKINLNISGYPSGQYIYEHNGGTNRFVVE
jgi:hypothetical protein